MPAGGANGDRIPTRERGYRSANQYVRRRAGGVPLNNINFAAGVEMNDE